MTYARGTEVPVDRTQAEIAATVRRYGATGFVSGWEGDRAMVEFAMRDRRVRFVFALPREADFAMNSRGSRTPAARDKAWNQACRERWRGVLLLVKAKLEAVASGIVTFEQAFLAHIVLPDGSTVYGQVRERLALAYSSGEMLPMLPGPRTGGG